MMFKRKTLFHFRRNIPPFYRILPVVFGVIASNNTPVPKKKTTKPASHLGSFRRPSQPGVQRGFLSEFCHRNDGSVLWNHGKRWRKSYIFNLQMCVFWMCENTFNYGTTVEISNSGCCGSKVWLDKIKWVILIFQIYSKGWIPYFWVHEPLLSSKPKGLVDAVLFPHAYPSARWDTNHS